MAATGFPLSKNPRTKLTAAQIEEAKARADAAGRRYPNLIDNMAVAKQAKKTAQHKKAQS